MANYQNEMKGKILGLAELADMFCIVKPNHILMSNGTNVIVPIDRDMSDLEMAIYLNNLSNYLQIGDFTLDPEDPDLVDNLYNEVQTKLIENKTALRQEDYDAFLDHYQNVKAALKNEAGPAAYVDEQYLNDVSVIVKEAEEVSEDILEQIKNERAKAIDKEIGYSKEKNRE